jgi:hypothetical protein
MSSLAMFGLKYPWLLKFKEFEAATAGNPRTRTSTFPRTGAITQKHKLGDNFQHLRTVLMPGVLSDQIEKRRGELFHAWVVAARKTRLWGKLRVRFLPVPSCRLGVPLSIRHRAAEMALGLRHLRATWRKRP